jgi:hypothetical protein
LGLSRRYEFLINGDIVSEEKRESLEDSLRKVLTLGAKSGVYHPAVEETRLLGPGAVPPWPRVGGHIDSAAQLKDAIVEAVVSTRVSAMRRTYSVSEVKPREKSNAVTEIRNPLATVMRSDMSFDDSLNRGGFAPSPLNFIVSLPKNPDRLSSVERFRSRCELVAALMDRPLGYVAFREESLHTMTFESLSPLPLNHRSLETSPSAEQSLFMLGPWDARNAVMERRLEWITRAHNIEGRYRGEIIDGEQDWISTLVYGPSGPQSWLFEESGVTALVQANLDRTRFHRVWFFWAADTALSPVYQMAAELKVPLHRIGRTRDNSKILVAPGPKRWAVDVALSNISFNAIDRDRPRDVTWTYPDFKSPTYGFERVAQHPYEYLEKILKITPDRMEWVRESRLCASGDRFRSVLSRNSSCMPLAAYRWTDGKDLFVEAMGLKEGWMDVDPRAAGIASFDAALRGLVAMGAEPSGGVGYLWVAQPEDSENVTENSSKWAAYVLALEGACAWAKAFDFKLHYINGGGVGFPGSRNEVFVDLRSRIQAASQVMVPGFRMEGEILYVVGPRPAFMDAGSKILEHVNRIFSNHTSKLNPDLQLRLYKELHRLAQQGVVTSLRAVGEGGVAEALGEMALWSGKGAQIRPNIPIIELFSGAPGRLVVGVLPQEAKRFEALIPAEQLTPIGLVGGEKILGLPVAKLFESRQAESKS